MRILHVITRLIIGGAQENTVSSVLGLRAKPGMDVQLITGPTTGTEGSLDSVLANNSLPLTIVPPLVRPLHPWKDWMAWRELVRLFRVQAPQIVHTHSSKAGVLGRLAAARAGVPIVVHTIHGPSFGSFQGWLANSIFKAAERHAARVTTHFVVVAEAMKQQYLAAGIGHPDQYTTILSGFALAPFLAAANDLQLRARLGLAPDDIVIGKIARLFKLKGHDDLLTVAPELVRHCPQIRFLFVGDGPWRGRFEKRVRALGLEKHVVFRGLVPPDAVPALVGIMDLVAHLSLREGLPRALAQALAGARPVVAYDSDGAREVCMENETGFLLQPGDLAGLRKRLLQLAQDRALRERLGRHGQQFVRERFGVERMVDRLYQLYRRLSGQPA
ncbi:MAG TPA: glycosyltransferase family 4 protein [Verrucomicrobiota bacterium]|jgi:glycosyltransferase involved in cell wall biosynthesis|nr:MAG: putative glycosyltransferase EpsD [Verrucomicrobia bacterium ADurb.Bin063]HNW06253.1 glycosyltransferase family 4 protein [Verrucomicrobiota bacterium]HNZ76815.1 glycosyltransferase family 4 protein [Verrucomicrobiota bacterium]HOC49905.1 glycosyltransferase family 4 protein [Verrucomicrobiota bacterium]HOH40666.1 glycosyltransferase family 4 protein [Verrucomicrobiota bacterium]